MECAVGFIVALVLAYGTWRLICRIAGWLDAVPDLCSNCEGYGKVPDISYGHRDCEDCDGTGFVIDKD